MFFFNEYNNNIVNIHLNEKIKFYRFKYFSSLKPIILLIKYVRLKYKVFNNIYDKKMLIGNKLLFYYYFNIPNKFLNLSSNDHSSYSVVLFKNILYKYNLFYYFYISFLWKSYRQKFFTETSKKLLLSKKYIRKSFSKSIKLVFHTFKDAPLNDIFLGLNKINAYINISLKSNTNNYFLNKVFYSHIFLNI